VSAHQRAVLRWQLAIIGACLGVGVVLLIVSDAGSFLRSASYYFIGWGAGGAVFLFVYLVRRHFTRHD